MKKYRVSYKRDKQEDFVFGFSVCVVGANSEQEAREIAKKHLYSNETITGVEVID